MTEHCSAGRRAVTRLTCGGPAQRIARPVLRGRAALPTVMLLAALTCAAVPRPAGAAVDVPKAEALVQAGQAAFDAGDLDRAVGYLEKAVEAAPGHQPARDRLAAAVRARAEKHVRSEALTAAGRTALANGAHDKAIPYFEKAIEDWQDNRDAQDGLREAIRLQRDTAKVHDLQLARLYARAGQSSKAEEHYLKALAVDPNDAELRSEVAEHLATRPLPRARAWLKAWTDVVSESTTWIVFVLVLAIVAVANLLNWLWSRQSIQVSPFSGPEAGFRDSTGQGMAAIASSQLHASGFALEPGGVVEPITALKAQLTDPQAKLLADVVSWVFPDKGFRLEAVVHQLPGVVGPSVTVKLIKLRFWLPRQRVVASTTFRPVQAGDAAHEMLARLAAAWAEWHVTRRDYATDDPRAFAFFVAGTFAQRLGQIPAAATLYQAACQADPRYHKAFNNRGLLILVRGLDDYANGPQAREAASMLLAAAQALFELAVALEPDVADYWYNLGTTQSYRAKLTGVRRLQHASVEAFRMARELVQAEFRPGSQPRRLRWLRSRRKHQALLRPWITRVAFAAQVVLGLATSLALVRVGASGTGEEERDAVRAAETLRRDEPMIRHNLRLNYNLGCYYVAAGRRRAAVEIFTVLAATNPEIGDNVRSDPDLAEAPEILNLFPALPPAPAPVPPAPAPAARPATPADVT